MYIGATGLPSISNVSTMIQPKTLRPLKKQVKILNCLQLLKLSEMQWCFLH